MVQIIISKLSLQQEKQIWNLKSKEFKIKSRAIKNKCTEAPGTSLSVHNYGTSLSPQFLIPKAGAG